MNNVLVLNHVNKRNSLNTRFGQRSSLLTLTALVSLHWRRPRLSANGDDAIGRFGQRSSLLTLTAPVSLHWRRPHLLADGDDAIGQLRHGSAPLVTEAERMKCTPNALLLVILT